MKAKKNKFKIIIPVVLIILLIIAYFVFSKPKYTVTFLNEDGSVYETIRVKEGNLCTLIDGPDKSGYKFYKWYYQDKSFDFSLPIEQDYTLNAKYIKEYTISLLNEDGSLFKTIYAGEGEKLVFPEETPEKANMAFNGWTLNGSAYNVNTVVTENFSLVASFREYVKAESISFTQSTMTIVLGESDVAYVNINPSNATETVYFTSSDNTIFTVDNYGNITPRKAGTATLTAKIEDITATCSITIIEIYPESFTPMIKYQDEYIEIEDKIYVAVDKKVQICPTFKPANTSAKTLSYEVDDEEIATVNTYGYVTGIEPGEVKLTMRTQRLPEQSIKVIVFTPLEKAELDANKTTIGWNETLNISLNLTLVELKKDDGEEDESEDTEEESTSSESEESSGEEGSEDDKKKEPYVENITYEIEWTCLDSEGEESELFEITPSKDGKSLSVKANSKAKTGDTCIIRANVTEPDGNIVSTKSITIEYKKLSLLF